MVNRYKILEGIKDKLPTLVSTGIIPISVYTYLSLYNHFLKERENNTIMQSYCNTSERFRCSERTVSRAVSYMESTDI